MPASNKPITYPRNHNLLDTETFRTVDKFVNGGAAETYPKAFHALRKVFGVPLRTKRKAAK